MTALTVSRREVMSWARQAVLMYWEPLLYLVIFVPMTAAGLVVFLLTVAWQVLTAPMRAARLAWSARPYIFPAGDDIVDEGGLVATRERIARDIELAKHLRDASLEIDQIRARLDDRELSKQLADQLDRIRRDLEELERRRRKDAAYIEREIARRGPNSEVK